MRYVKITITLGALLIAGCANIRIDPYEANYQALTVVDYTQTLDIVRRPDCLHELGLLTTPVIGSEPTATGVTSWFVVMDIAHLAISNWLNREVDATDSNRWRTVRATWRVFSIGFEGLTVGQNFQRGIEPLSHNLTATCNNRYEKPKMVAKNNK